MNQEIFKIPFFKSSDFGFRNKKFFMQVLVDILPLGSGSVDLHIFADPDPGSQYLANPTDLDPKYCWNVSTLSP